MLPTGSRAEEDCDMLLPMTARREWGLEVPGDEVGDELMRCASKRHGFRSSTRRTRLLRTNSINSRHVGCFFLTLPTLFRIIESIMPDELPPPGAIVARRPCGHLVG